jgi:hypothetical protein
VGTVLQVLIVARGFSFEDVSGSMFPKFSTRALEVTFVPNPQNEMNVPLMAMREEEEGGKYDDDLSLCGASDATSRSSDLSQRHSGLGESSGRVKSILINVKSNLK